MGKLLPQYQKAVVEDILNAIESNTANYYAFAANPIYNNGVVADVTTDDYTTYFSNDWQMLFGKRIANSEFFPVISNNLWKANTVYTRYDNTVANLSNYYVVCPPSSSGGSYQIFKCIDNANGAPATIKPTTAQTGTITTGDNYKWRYITSVTAGQYNKVATNDFVPATSNSNVISAAASHNGVEVVVINNAGIGYSGYTNGTVQSVYSNTLLQIETFNTSSDNDFYTKNAIYIYNTGSPTGQLRTITRYVSNGSGNWVYTNSAVDTVTIYPGSTKYYISPRVVFESDADSQPSALSYVDPVANSISNILMIDTGVGVSWCNVSIQSNTTYGSNASLYAIIPPPGGHGSNPQVELQLQGFAVSFFFANSENGTIPANTVYNKLGLIKNPYKITTAGVKDTAKLTSNTFSAVLQANLVSAVTFTIGTTVIGQVSGARGTVAYSNSTVIYLTGDKNFNNELIVSSDGLVSSNIVINTLGDIYTKDLYPLYIQNISNVVRANTQTETFKLIIKV
jgi:hypothetical protein